MHIKINTKIIETRAALKAGEIGIILNFSAEPIPVKILKMRCFHGNEVRLIQDTPFSNLLFFKSVV